MFEIEIYQKSSGKSPLKDYIDNLSKTREAEYNQVQYFIDLLRDHGLQINNYHRQAVKPIQDDVYELRPGNNRIFFFVLIGNRIVLLHAFRKKSRKTPLTEIEKAISEMNDYKRRYENEKLF